MPNVQYNRNMSNIGARVTLDACGVGADAVDIPLTTPRGFDKIGTAAPKLTRTGAGVYTLQLKQRYARMLGYEMSVLLATGHLWDIAIDSDTSKTTGLLTIRTFLSGVATDLPAAAFCITLQFNGSNAKP